MTSEQHADAEPIDAEDARRNPERAVDEMERRILGDSDSRLDGRYPGGVGPEERDGEGPDGRTRSDPAFETDLEPEEQGGSAAAADNPD